jgi:curli biogenesis system outer membrane secretion channel CsgG
MQRKIPWQILTSAALAVLCTAAAYGAETPVPSCPAKCFEQQIVYARQEAVPTSAGPQEAGGAKGAASTAALKPLSGTTSIERYSAQRKPRVAVVTFQDTNRDAQTQIYSSSVDAMLVTFLKRKSQFVVVERRDIDDVLEEWKIKKNTNMRPLDASNGELLEKIDAILIGSVTMLEAPSSVDPTSKNGANGGGPSGEKEDRVEVDLKALGVSDGRIIAAAKSSGPVHCLRSIVERLGVALEEAFLRPYYGSLQFNLASPNNVRIYLTPILLDKALDEEKPPIEHGESIIEGPRRDSVEAWSTDPTSYTVKNLLAGWYTYRLERQGYDGMGIKNGNEGWQARELGGKVQVSYTDPDGRTVPYGQVPELERRFVVHVEPRGATRLDGDRLHLAFEGLKLGGSLDPRVRRQFLDPQFDHRPRRVILIGKEGLDLNRVERPVEFSDDPTCDLFEEKAPREVPYGKTYVAEGVPFDFDTFKGGDLIIDNYEPGQKIPTGKYQIAIWEPDYQLLTGTATVSPGDYRRPLPSALVRESLPLTLDSTGSRKPYKVFLKGKATENQTNYILGFAQDGEPVGLPVDAYRATTNVPGLLGWEREVEVFPRVASTPPRYDSAMDEEIESQKANARLRLKEAGKDESELGPFQYEMPITLPEKEDPADVPLAIRPALRVKTRLAVGGRLAALGSLAAFDSEEYFIDEQVAPLLDLVMGPEILEKIKAGATSFWRAMGSHLFRTASRVVEVVGPPRPEGDDRSEARNRKEEGSPTDGPKAAPEIFPKEPALLRNLLTRRLQDLDLLVLDDRDMRRVRESPELTSILERYLADGGALYAFVSEPGDYGRPLGTPLALKTERKTRRFELVSGDVPTVEVPLSKKRVSVRSRRALLQPEAGLGSGWRVIAYGKGRNTPRILEHGGPGSGGYVALWLDQPALFRSRILGSRVPAIEDARARVEKHAVDWARYLMYRRYDSQGEERRKAEETLRLTGTSIAPEPAETATALSAVTAAPVVSISAAERLKKLDELKKQGLLTQAEYDQKRMQILEKL